MAKCMACDEPITVGQKYFYDVSGDLIHDDCAGNDGFVNLETEEPLDHRPEPSVWTQEDQDMADGDEA